MTVAELRSRMTEAEYADWIAFFNWRGEEAKRIREGLPPTNPEEQTPEQIHQVMTRFTNERKAALGNG